MSKTINFLIISTRLAKHEEDIAEINRHMATKEDIKQIKDNFINNENIKQIVILDNQQFEANEAYKDIYKKLGACIMFLGCNITYTLLFLMETSAIRN